MGFYLRKCFVDDEFARKAPLGGIIINEVCSFPDMKGIIHVASIVRWLDAASGQCNLLRYGAFDAKTGEYLGEYLGEN